MPRLFSILVLALASTQVSAQNSADQIRNTIASITSRLTRPVAGNR